MSTASTAAVDTAGEPPEQDTLAQLLLLRRHLRELEASPVITGAHKVARNLGPVLEPVWGLLAGCDDGVGYLRQYGTGRTAPAAERANAAVAAKAVRAYRKLRLVGPERHQVWAALANPADALLRTASSPLPLPTEQEGITTTLHIGVRPALPAVLHLDWDDDRDVVPALRAVLRRWCDLAHRAGGTTGELSRITLASALLARGAALDGDTATVSWFIERWLGLFPTNARVDGAIAVLLENDWTRNRVDSQLSMVIDTVTQLRLDASHQHRLHRPAWETQLRGMPVALLADHPFEEPQDPEDPVEAAALSLLKEQVWSVLDTLSEREAGVIMQLVMEEATLKNTAILYATTTHQIKKIREKAMGKLLHGARRDILEGCL
ncbi:hypothetical protein [Streptomyces sp. NPDC127108]|uniref:hypothetical protein n=1 Tax=Streptomyces sp. NPDC127108 TaxID=3345361 RepID=UPI003624B3EA